MRIWRASWHDAHAGHRYSWHYSKREAEKALRDEGVVNEPGASVDLIDFKTDKLSVINWLNIHLTHDNG